MSCKQTFFDAILLSCKGLEENRVVTIKLKDVVAATDGDTLDEALTFFFTTKYNPLHATANRIRAEIGRFVSDVPDDTIHQLSHKWSLRADILRNRGLNVSDFYGTGAESSDLVQMIKSDYVTAKVCIDLLSGSYGDTGFQKSLADLRVMRQSGGLQNALRKYEDAAGRLETALLEGGFLGQRAQGLIRGQYDSDRPAFGRLWDPTSNIPAANKRVRLRDRWGFTERQVRKGFGKRRSRTTKGF